MDFILQYPPSKNILDRFPPEKFVAFKIPYVVVNKKLNKIMVLEKTHVEKYKNIHWFIAIFKKMSWSIKNDLIGKSQLFNQEKMMMVTDPHLYYENCIRELLIVIIDEENEKEIWMEESVLKSLDKDILNGIMYYFFEHKHFDGMTEDEEWDLRKRLHKYYRYWQLKESRVGNSAAIARTMDVPICPSIVWKVSLAERFGWDFDQIERLSEKDLREIQILSSQEKMSSFEGDALLTCSSEEQIIAHNKMLQDQNALPIAQAENQAVESKANMAHNFARKFKNSM